MCQIKCKSPNEHFSWVLDGLIMRRVTLLVPQKAKVWRLCVILEGDEPSGLKWFNGFPSDALSIAGICPAASSLHTGVSSRHPNCWFSQFWCFGFCQN